MTTLEVLKASTYFQSLKEQDLEKISALFQEQLVSANEFIFREGDPATRIYMLVEGSVAIQVKVTELQDAVVGTFSRPGELFGWSAVLPNKHYTASAKCLKAARALFIEGTQLEALFSDDPALGFLFMKIIAGLIDRRLLATRQRLLSNIS